MPAAFVTVRDGATTTESEIIEHVRAHHPLQGTKTVTFCDLSKTSTGKVQKYVLRNNTAK